MAQSARQITALQSQLSDRTERAMARARHPSATTVVPIVTPPKGDVATLIGQMSDVIAEQALLRNRAAVLRRKRASLKRSLAEHGVRL